MKAMNLPPRRRPEIEEPGARSSVPASQLVTSYMLALVLPTLTALLLVPFRVEHPQTTAIVLVIPVILVALRGATGPAVAAALVAGLAYATILTEPYGHPVIDDPDDAVAAFTLLAVATVVGLLSSRLARIHARDAARRGELSHILRFAMTLTAYGSPEQERSTEQLADTASRHIAEVLHLSDCEWRAGFRGGSLPVLYPDGMVSGYVSELNPDRAKLPRQLELPAISYGEELGRFILSPRHDSVTSQEERLTAATIAQLFALQSSERHGSEL
jgi:hypothetical protein